MSEIYSHLGQLNVNAFDRNLFRREDDFLNVFKEISSNRNLDQNFNVVADGRNNNWDNPHYSDRFGLNDIDVDSHEATFDFQEINDSLSEDFKNFDDSFIQEKYLKEPVDQLFKSDSDLDGDIFTAQKKSLSIDEDSPLSRPATAYTINESSLEIDVTSNRHILNLQPENIKSSLKTPTQNRSRTRLFSRRKDVIIKTLLRKCRKFFLKDFNIKTNYLKSSKRKFGSSVYKTLLDDYITKVFKIPCNEKLLLFMGVFLYQTDLEENLDLFVSPNYTPKDIKQLIVSVHNILYKYSHQKFDNFSKNEEFKFVFTYFDEVGTDEIKQDHEYALGLDLIKGQL